MGRRKRYAPRTVRLTDGTPLPYRAYLRSPAWAAFKDRFRRSRLYTGRCYVCGGTEQLQLHHRTYKRAGRERLHDVVELCESCHAALHEFLRSPGATGRVNLWTAARRLRRRLRGRRSTGPASRRPSR